VWNERRRLLSLDAKTGQPTAGFGTDGFVDLKAGADNGFPHAQYNMNSPPSVYKDLVITGAEVQELPGAGASGDIRAWDLHTGKLVWRFHSVPLPGEAGHDTWPGDSWKNRSGTNVWGFMSVDLKQGLVFLPFGSPSYDFYAPDRKGKRISSATRSSRSMPTPANWCGISKRSTTTSLTTTWNRLLF
jgi:glucose dehydrogenase